MLFSELFTAFFYLQYNHHIDLAKPSFNASLHKHYDCSLSLASSTVSSLFFPFCVCVSHTLIHMFTLFITLFSRCYEFVIQESDSLLCIFNVS